MPRLCAPRLIGTIACAFAVTAAPAAAHEARSFEPLQAYADVVHSLNPQLPFAKCRAYANSVITDAQRTGVDPRLIMAVVTVESDWRTNARSYAGARGLGQLMPRTAMHLNVDAWDWGQNLRGTASYLRTLINRFHDQPDHYRLAIAGYNAGPGAVTKFNGVPPYSETQHYVAKVLRVWQQLNARVGFAWSHIAHRSLAHRILAPQIAEQLETSDTMPPPTMPNDFPLVRVDASLVITEL
jgi:soluble lytic murein transglycosylase-like protein